MARPDIMIDYLADQPEFLKEIARLSWREWQEFIKEKIETSLKNYQARMNANRLALTLVALHDCELISLVSLKLHDMFRQQPSIILTA